METNTIQNAHSMSNLPASNHVWYAVRVRHQNEKKISSVFHEKLCLHSYVPTRKVWKRKNGKKLECVKPLLSSYVFINANIKTINWRLFFSASGVTDIVRQCGKPAPISDEEIKSLEALCRAENPVYETDYKNPGFNDRVIVTDGPLSGAVGNFIKINESTGHFIVSLDLFKRSLETELDVDFVRPY
ncbi:MAG: transcription termination/antitermination protein NusG [Nitrospinota bacterium]